jgi:phosphopantothenoylcysteine synthetase/decarboxylase
MNILLGVSGGISAYKAADFILGLQKSGNHNIRVIMTDNAKKFITPLTLATLSKNPVMCDMWEDRTDIEHIEVGKWASAFIVYPATANIIAKFANGIADDTLSTAYLALPKRVQKFVCPAMNTNMLEHPATQENIVKLRLRDSVKTSPTRKTILACGDEGEGGLLKPRDAIKWFHEKVVL